MQIKEEKGFIDNFGILSLTFYKECDKMSMKKIAEFTKKVDIRRR
jgi:hypothetical protein